MKISTYLHHTHTHTRGQRAREGGGGGESEMISRQWYDPMRNYRFCCFTGGPIFMLIGFVHFTHAIKLYIHIRCSMQNYTQSTTQRNKSTQIYRKYEIQMSSSLCTALTHFPICSFLTCYLESSFIWHRETDMRSEGESKRVEGMRRISFKYVRFSPCIKTMKFPIWFGCLDQTQNICCQTIHQRISITAVNL